MNENQQKWLKELQSKGVKFEDCDPDYGVWEKTHILAFYMVRENYRIPAQPIPDIPDWREVCRDMQSKGVMLEHFGLFSQSWGVSSKTKLEIHTDKTKFRIPSQPIPEWGEEMIEEPTAGVTTIANAAALSQAAQILKEELDKIPHRELQIQWHEDRLHHLRTGEPMRAWEFIDKYYKDWQLLSNTPSWSADLKYRRKPRTKKIQLWYCVGQSAERPDIVNAFSSLESLDDLICKCDGMSHKIISTVSKIEVEIPEQD